MKKRKNPLITEFTVYKTEKILARSGDRILEHEWRWKMRDRRSQKIIAASTEGYKRRIDAVRNLKRVANCAVPQMKPYGMLFQWVLFR